MKTSTTHSKTSEIESSNGIEVIASYSNHITTPKERKMKGSVNREAKNKFFQKHFSNILCYES